MHPIAWKVNCRNFGFIGFSEVHSEVSGVDLKRLRAECGLTQEGLARLSGVSRPAIHRIENSQQAPRRGTVKKLAQALGVAPWEMAPGLFTRPGSKPPGIKVTSEVREQFEGYIAALAFKIAQSPADMEDLKGAGHEGLVEACMKFKDTGGMAFDPWVKHYVRNRILDEARRLYEGTDQVHELEEVFGPDWNDSVGF
jgi:transcriptional regulator with XRE-family HTH domain